MNQTPSISPSREEADRLIAAAASAAADLDTARTHIRSAFKTLSDAGLHAMAEHATVSLDSVDDLRSMLAGETV